MSSASRAEALAVALIRPPASRRVGPTPSPSSSPSSPASSSSTSSPAAAARGRHEGAHACGGPCAPALTPRRSTRPRRRGADGRWRRRRCRRARPPDTMSRAGSTTPSARRQSKTSPDPGDSASTSTAPAPYSSKRAMLRCPAGKALMVRAIRAATQRVSSVDLVPVQLGGPQPDAVHDLHHPGGRLVAEDPHREDLGRHALDDAPHGLRRHLARRRGEDEADGVGPQPHRQQGVGFGRDPADLHEHGVTVTASHPSRDGWHRRGPRLGARRARAPRPGGRPPSPGTPPRAPPESRRRPDARTSSRAADARTRPPPPRRAGWRRQAHGPVAVDGEGGQVALVHAHQASRPPAGPGRARASSCTSTRASSPSSSAPAPGTPPARRRTARPR